MRLRKRTAKTIQFTALSKRALDATDGLVCAINQFVVSNTPVSRTDVSRQVAWMWVVVLDEVAHESEQFMLGVDQQSGACDNRSIRELKPSVGDRDEEQRLQFAIHSAFAVIIGMH